MHIHATADKAVVRVTDNGWGICKKDQKQIFKQFYRVLHKQNPKGFGIGLVLAKYIVEAHHGKITVESELDKGSTFGGFTLNKETNNLYDRQRHATHLTNKQTQVLEFLIAHQGEIVPREILKKNYGKTATARMPVLTIISLNSAKFALQMILLRLRLFRRRDFYLQFFEIPSLFQLERILDACQLITERSIYLQAVFYFRTTVNHGTVVSFTH